MILTLYLYKTPKGLLFREDGEDETNGITDKPVEKKKQGGKCRRGKGDFGASLEDEEWERQMRKELAHKKAASTSGKNTASGSSLSVKEKELVDRQDKERRRIAGIVDGKLCRALSAIQSLCLSDIEVGNSSLPSVSESVIKAAISKCAAIQGLPSLRAQCLESLTSLATCVYEIGEEYAPAMAHALIISYRRSRSVKDGANDGKNLIVSALPSPCEAAACTITEMDDLHDHLSGASFSFLFPVIRAALTGPRTTPGCEGALRVLERHTYLLAGDDRDPVVASLRKDMAGTVLELLAHDRSQTFIDPTPYDALISCYRTEAGESADRPALSTSEIAPLLDERGALGSQNCRLGAMLALGAIAAKHQKLCKKNPLIENRVWLNCFDKNDRVQEAARTTWKILTEDEGGALSSILPPIFHVRNPIAPTFEPL